MRIENNEAKSFILSPVSRGRQSKLEPRTSG